MAREIKFRAWFPSDHWVVEEYGQMVNEYTSLTLLECFGFHDDEIQYMQYTGLKDKNGVEIYCSDIVHLYGEKDYPVNVISFGNISWECSKVELRWHVGFGGTVLDGVVIGNIYQNPDLLKGGERHVDETW